MLEWATVIRVSFLSYFHLLLRRNQSHEIRKIVVICNSFQRFVLNVSQNLNILTSIGVSKIYNFKVMAQNVGSFIKTEESEIVTYLETASYLRSSS